VTLSPLTTRERALIGPLSIAYTYLCRRLEIQRTDEASSPLVVFDCDQTLITGDIGETLLFDLLETLQIKGDSVWWSMLAPVVDPEPLREAYERALTLDDPLDVDLLSSIWAAYSALCVADIRAGYLWAASCFNERSSRAVRARCRAFLAQALEAPALSDHRDHPRGVRLRPQLISLIDALHAREVEVWIVSSSQQPMVESVAERYGIPLQRVIGIDFERDAEDRYTRSPRHPIPVAEAKWTRLNAEVGRAPTVMFGDSRHDLPLMKIAGGGVLIHPPNTPLWIEAEEHGFLCVSPDQVECER
jgi:HAD superfamily phosphoserine phosphatase-like hydrolase